MAEKAPAEEPGDGNPAPVETDPLIARQAVLDDPELSSEDYMRASTDSEYLAELVGKRAAGGGEAQPGEGDGERRRRGWRGQAQAQGRRRRRRRGGRSRCRRWRGDGEVKVTKPRRRPGYKRRAEALLEQNDALIVERDELRRKLATNGQPAGKKKAAPAARPKMDDFEDEDAFLDALIDWRSDKKIDDRMAARDQTQTKKAGDESRRRQAVDAATELDRQFQVGRDTYEDYDTVLEAADDIEWTDRHAYAMMLTGEAGDIAYHLGQNPDEAAKLAKITHPGKISMEMGRIQVRVEAERAKREKEDPAKEDPPKGAAAKIAKKKNPKPMKNHIDGGAAPGVKDEAWWAEKSSPQEYLTRQMEKRKALGR